MRAFSWGPLAASAAGSLALFLGTPNPLLHLPFFILLYPASLYFAALHSSFPFRSGWSAGIPGAAAALYWIAVAAHKYGGFPWLLAAPCSLLLGIYVALWGGLFALAMSELSMLSGIRRCAAAGLLWFLLEWSRGWFFTGFPWLTISSGLAAWPIFIQPVSVLGEYGYSGVLVFLTCLLCECWLFLRKGECGKGMAFLGATCVQVMFLAAFGIWRISVLPERLAAEGVPVSLTLVQGSVRQDVKWSPEYQKDTLERYIRLSLEGVRAGAASDASTVREGDAQFRSPASPGMGLGGGEDALLLPVVPDLLLWPETAMPFYYPESSHAGTLRAFVRELGIPLLFGAPGFERGPDGSVSLFNRAFLLIPEGDAGHYDKEHLVPFGEYLPPVLDWKIFEPLLQGLGGFVPGTGEPLFELSLAGRPAVSMGMLICYEAIFPELARRRTADGAQILLNISNDAWYDRTSAPMQHLQLSLLRAVEQGRYMARATNSGITAFFDPLGGIHAMGTASDEYALFVSGSLTGTVLALDGHTLYFYLHPWLPAVAFGLLAALALPAIRRFPGKKQTVQNFRAEKRQDVL